MAHTGITPIVMPKWGLEMREGTIAGWLVEEGMRIEVGQPIVDVETDKISNAVEAPDPGLLRRKVAKDGETLPVKALLGVLAEPEVSDADIDAYIASYVVPAAAEGEDEQPAFAWVEVGGIRVRHARRGPEAGTPVLFIHGFGGDLGNWLFNLDAIAETLPVIALDLPGHGQSDPKLPGTTLTDLAGFVARFLDAIGVPRAHVVGHSMGGAIAARLALEAPQRVASLMLVNSAGLGGEINTDYIEGFVTAASRRELKPVIEHLFADPSLVTRQLLDDLLKYKRLDGVTELLRALSASLFAGGRQAEQPALELEGSGVPVAVVWGEADRVIPASHAHHAPPGAKVTVLPGAGHMTMMEKASDFNALLRGHLAEC
ncbi:acetoin dehydrogenase dihydrolipoyllysine-residue acetyltransferase subunit [Tepidimonas taiwanensis]|uniref:acetoin dehydrogenase dihydrolipoyllysine-residue acetyltransferase subunit n=1 Tax=Tepidimonas taiwanensis TaxID=307486 RepID=UPI0005BC3360|nr:acetoin dehydrogenase dihydrolipoyllysine-residue acetyltransferase subunit [Tepidimonas taiwanensis]